MRVAHYGFHLVQRVQQTWHSSTTSRGAMRRVFNQMNFSCEFALQTNVCFQRTAIGNVKDLIHKHKSVAISSCERKWLTIHLIFWWSWTFFCCFSHVYEHHMIIYAKVIPYMGSAFRAAASVSEGLNFRLSTTTEVRRQYLIRPHKRQIMTILNCTCN